MNKSYSRCYNCLTLRCDGEKIIDVCQTSTKRPHNPNVVCFLLFTTNYNYSL